MPRSQSQSQSQSQSNSKGKKKSRRSQRSDESDDSDSDYEVQECRRSSQSQSQSLLTNAQLKELAGQVCNLLLAGEVKKIPVKRAFIKKSILKGQVKSFDSVMKKAKEMMKEVFGYKIVFLKDGYILVNSLSSKIIENQDLSRTEASSKGLLTAILMAIFMSDGKIPADALGTFLKTLDYDIIKLRPFFLELTKKKYLLVSNENTGESQVVMFQWGERAHAEFRKKEMLELVCKVYGNMKLTQWKYQYNVIKQEMKNENAVGA